MRTQIHQLMLKCEPLSWPNVAIGRKRLQVSGESLSILFAPNIHISLPIQSVCYSIIVTHVIYLG